MKNSRKRTKADDNLAFMRNLERAAQLWPQIVEKMASHSSIHQQTNEPLAQQVGEAFWEFQNRLLQQSPESFAKAGLEWWQSSLELGQRHWQQFLGGSDATPETEESEHDRRFKHASWTSNPFYQNMKEQYQLTAKLIDDTLQKANDNLDGRSAHLVEFYGKQWRDALSPSNYPWSNPEVMEHAIETNGESLLHGLENLLHDLEQGRITMTPEEAFTLGEDIAATKGSVVFENELMQLIQYEATTKDVYQTPLLITPAWINKYYVLDLQSKNSLVKWLTEQGYTVFIISWVNPDESHHEITFGDYLMKGAWTAAQQVLEITGEKKLHISGYCLGGTLTACLAAWLAAEGKANCIASTSYLTTLIDFEKAGDLKVFIDDNQLNVMEETLDKRGYLEGSEMAAIFNALRPQDLIWSFVVNNYLLGKTPTSYDLLFWNGDVTRMPAKMHLFYLREMYLNNALAKGKLSLGGHKIDLTTIKTPSYLLATKEDHIAPWKATYEALKLYQGKKRFVLSGSGHIAGVVNPPAKNKYYWLENNRVTDTHEEWLEQATRHDGSWWNDWVAWLASQHKNKVPARKIENAIEAAPGRYVKKRV